jgi:hypothetical protein
LGQIAPVSAFYTVATSTSTGVPVELAMPLMAGRAAGGAGRRSGTGRRARRLWHVRLWKANNGRHEKVLASLME